MKTYKELKLELENETNSMSPDSPQGVSMVFARNAKKHGDDAVRRFKSAQTKLNKRTLDTSEDRIGRLAEGLNDLVRV